MHFYKKGRSETPTVMIIPLIDILMSLLMFTLVTTTFKTHPLISVRLPESTQSQSASVEPNWIVITITTNEPYFYIGDRPFTLQELERELLRTAMEDPNRIVSLRADELAPWGKIVQAMDAVRNAGFKNPVAAFTRPATKH